MGLQRTRRGCSVDWRRCWIQSVISCIQANYCIGCVADTDNFDIMPESPWCCGTDGVFQSRGQRRTDIPSLYDAQLAESKAQIHGNNEFTVPTPSTDSEEE